LKTCKKSGRLAELIKLYVQGTIKSKIDIYRHIFRFSARPTDKILDAGCNVGTRTIELLKVPGVYVCAMDISLHNIKATKKAALEICSSNQLDMVLGDLLHLPIRNGAFNKILCTEVLEHVSNDQKAFRELCRVLQIGGTLMISVPTFFAETFFAHLGMKHPYHLRTYTLEKISSMVSEQLRVINLERMYSKTFFFLTIVALSHTPMDFNRSQVKRQTLILRIYEEIWRFFDKLSLAGPLDYFISCFTPFARSWVIAAVKEPTN